jgi:hypothetical protein
MKKILCLLALSLFLNVGQAQAFIYIDTIEPLIATNMDVDNVKNLKCGQCQISRSWFIRTGHAGIQQAAIRGGITKIHHVDVKRRGFLGFGMTTIQVYGE